MKDLATAGEWFGRHRVFARRVPTLLLGCGAIAVVTIDLMQSYNLARANAEQTVENLTYVLSDQAERTLQSVDLSLQALTEDLQDHSTLADNDPRFRESLRRRLKALPYVRALFVIRPDGYISHDTDYPSTPHVSLADRPYFVNHRRNPSLESAIARPLKSRSTGGWFVSMTRRIEARDGSFGGVAVAAVEPLYFEHFYRRLWVGNGTISLYFDDGVLLSRVPGRESATGQSFQATEPFRSLLRARRSGIFWLTSPIDGRKRVAGYRAMTTVPLVTIVALNEADVMRSWRMHAVTQSVGLIFLLALLALLEWFSIRSRRREEDARKRLDATHRFEAIGRFASSVAHDFGNLKSILRANVAALQPFLTQHEEARPIVEDINLTLDTTRQLINQLLTYSHNGRLQPQRLDIGLLVSEFLPILEQAAGPRVQVVYMPPDIGVSCLADGPQLKAALLNLVANARAAMPSGGVISISVAIVSIAERRVLAERCAEISVKDNGAGMPPDVLRHATDPFFTTKETSAGGIGLTQVAEYVRLMEGHMAIVSREGEGTCVSLRFPIGEGKEGACG